eukprot:scaffold32918_cov55-Attheya_sp.AAC.3
MRDALVPPNPKLLLIETLMGVSSVSSVTKRMPSLLMFKSVAGSKLRVGGTAWSTSVMQLTAASTAPAAPNMCPVAPLVLLT